MKYVVSVVINNMERGSAFTVPFFADTAERANLLSDLLRTVNGKDNAGRIASYRGDNSHLVLQTVLDPAALNLYGLTATARKGET